MAKLRVAVIYLGRRGVGGILTWEIARRLQTRAQVLLVGSTYVMHGPNWHTDWQGDRILVPTYRGLLRALSSLLDLRPILNLAQHIQAWQPDVLWFPMFHPWNPYLQRLLPHPSVIAVHDPVPHPGWRDHLYKILETLSIHKASYLFAWSRYGQQHIQHRYPEKRVGTLRLGPLDYYRTWHPERVARPQGILFFGRIEPYKGLDVLLQACIRLQRDGRPILLHIVGPGNIREYQRWLKQCPFVRLVNTWIPDEAVAGYFLNTLFTVLPYHSATQSGVVPVAAAFARTVIATPVGALPEQFTPHQSGILLPSNDPQTLAQYMDILLAKPERALQMGQTLYTEYHTQDIWNQNAERLLEAFHRVQ